MYGFQSVSWLTFLLKLDKCRDISSSGWDISLIFLDIPGMLVHYFQIILNFLYVCQSVSWLSWLHKYNIFGILMLNGWGIHKKLHNIPIYWKHYFFGSFFKFLQVQSIALANNVHFCNQLSKLVLLIPMNPKFISKFFKPLLRGGSFFQWAGGSP